MKVLTIIPARKGSKRLPGKNTKTFCGKPLIAHTFDLTSTLDFDTTVVVSSDDPRVLELASSYRNIIPIERPSKLAKDESLAIDYVTHALDHFEDQSFDVVMILQVTSPFTLVEDVIGCIGLYKQRMTGSVVSVAKIPFDQHPSKFKIMSGDLLLQPYLEDERAMEYQNLPKIYTRNGSIYMTSVDFIRTENKVLSPDCLGYEMPAIRSVDINDPLDFELAEFLNQKFQFISVS